MSETSSIDRRRPRRARDAAAIALLAVATAVSAQPALEQDDGASRGALGTRPDTIVVSASRTAQSLAEAPAAMTVIESAQIATSAADDYGDLLRRVPGLNVAQTGVRDINVTARGATSTLAGSQLALIDGRSIYLDFFGFVAWDLLPIQPQEIERIEVVRGPGSAVWGANAMSGVVNVITKRPRDLAGTTVIVGTTTAAVLHANATDALAYKVSAGYFEQSPYERPSGQVPGAVPPQTYPEFDNGGTRQARLDADLDWDLGERGTVSFSGGYADTGGILHSGIGPFDIDDGSALSYVQADWQHNAWRVAIAGSFLDGDAVNLLTRRSNGMPLSFAFVTDTYDLDVSNTSILGARHSLTYGASYRTNDFELEIAPGVDTRRQWSLFLQDDMRLGDRFRWVIGTRYHDDDALAEAALAPRTSFIFAPSDANTFRLSYGEAFRTPSAVNEYLDVTILQQAGPLLVPADADGNPALEEERMAAYEIGYIRAFRGGLMLTIDVYRNEIADSIDFFVADAYGPGALPAPGAGLPPAVIPCFNFSPGTGPEACPFGGLAGLVPSSYSYRNVGEIVNRGVEVGLVGNRGDWTWQFNVSWQDEPQVGGGIDAVEINVPPARRANLGVARDLGRRFWNASLSYQDEAYWADVLFARATTQAFAQLDAAAGWRFLDERLMLKISVQNLTDRRLQQHIFGDIIERRMEALVSYELRAAQK